MLWHLLHLPESRARGLRGVAAALLGARSERLAVTALYGVVRRLARVPAGRQKDPRVRFFLERNPGYAAGDELVCLTEVGEGNMKGLAKRLYREGYALGVNALTTPGARPAAPAR